MKNVPRVLLLASIVFVVGSVHAQTVSWKYVQGGWGTFDPDVGSRQNGWFVGGAVDLGKAPIHFIGDFGRYDDIDIWQAGAGWHGLLGKRADLFADGTFYDIDIDDGFKIRFGVRWMVLKRLELNGYLAWTELDLSDNKSASVNAIFDFSKRFGVGGGVDWGDNFGTARAFVRFNFGARG